MKRLNPFIVQSLSIGIAVPTGIFSPLQAIAVIGLQNLCTTVYYASTGSSAWWLNFKV
jgi:hypothetical protein